MMKLPGFYKMRELVRNAYGEVLLNQVLEAVESDPLAKLHQEWGMPGNTASQDDGQRQTAQQLCYALYPKNETLRKIVHNYLFFVFGKGFIIKFKNQSLQRHWDLLQERNDLNAKIREAILNCFIGGEWFHEVWPKGTEIKLDVRSIHPEEVLDIATAPNDREMPLNYTVQRFGSFQGDPFPAQDIFHWHFNKSSLALRGRPLCETVIHRLAQLDELLLSQLKTRRIKGQFNLIRYLKSKPLIGLGKVPKAAVIEAHDGHERWEQITKDVDASGAQQDVVTLVRVIAAGVDLPVEMILMDVSGSASAEMHLETIPVKAFADAQEHFRKQVRRFVFKIMGRPAMGLDAFDVLVPPIDVRNSSRRSEDLVRHQEASIISMKTTQEMLGYDPAKEKNRINEELGTGGAAAGELPELPGSVDLTAGLPDVSAPPPPQPGAADVAQSALITKEQVLNGQKLISSFTDAALLDQADIPGFDQVYLGVDDGFSTEFAFLGVSVVNNKVYVFEERYARNMRLVTEDETESRSQLIEDFANEYGAEGILIDPSATELFDLMSGKHKHVHLGSRDAERRFHIVDSLVHAGHLRISNELTRLIHECNNCLCKHGEAGFKKLPHNRQFHGLDALSYVVAWLYDEQIIQV